MDEAHKHFLDTLGTIPAAVEVLAEHAPGALDGYLTMRTYAHREPPDGDLDAPTRELLFIVLDVVEGHVDGAKAHAEMGIKAGLTVGTISQALVIAMMVSGIHTWSQHGHEVVAHAARFAAAGETASPN
jgi:alkylhydroperoxidase/carboxymuconolactone decarboxylase family protein YurZ